MRVAVIDLGTNTCNFLIADTDKSSFKRFFHHSYPVLLGENGINNQRISSKAISRAKCVIKKCIELSDKYNTKKIFAFATSAVRSAKNGKDFAMEIKESLGLDLQIITGNEEAEYIFKGIKYSVPLCEKNVLILDIGGGSNEFIIANNIGILWKKSYPLGMARLNEKFIFSDPYKKNEILELEEYLISELFDLFIVVDTYKPETLIGASGSFETFSNLLIAKHPKMKTQNDDAGVLDINIDDYFMLHNEIISKNIKERIQMRGMDTIRVEMIALASIFLNIILKKCDIKKIIKTDYSLNEGVVYSLLNHHI